MDAGSVFVKIKADMGDFNKSMSGMSDKLKKVQDNLNNFGRTMSTRVTAPIAGVGVAMLKSAADLEATEAKYNTVFNGMTEQVDAFITEFQKLTPATQSEARSMASGMQDLLVPMGFAREEATDMTSEFMHVAGALTNFNSATHSAQDVTVALQAAITGEYEGLKRLGVQLDATTVKEKAVEMGLAASTEEVTKQHQAQVLLSEIYAQSGDALTAYNEENLDTKTRMGLLRAEVTDVAASFGQLMLPALSDIVETMRGAVEWLGSLTDGQREMVLRTGALVAAIGPLSLIVSGLISTVRKATMAFKAVKAGMLALSGPIGIAILAIGALVAVGVHLYKTNEEVRDRVNAAFESIRDFIVKVIIMVKSFIHSKLREIQAFWDENGEQIMEIVRTAFNWVLDKIENVMKLVGGIMQFAWANIKIIIDTALGIVMGLIEVFIGILTGDFEKIKEGLTEIWGALWGGITDVVTGIIDLAFGWGSDLFNKLWDGMKEVWSKLSNWFTGKLDWIKDKLSFWRGSQAEMEGGTEVRGSVNLSGITGLATGTDYWKGGPAVVGEEGPELVNLPRGSSVIPNGGANGVSISGNTFNIREEADINKVARELYNMQVSTNRGLGL